MSSLASWEGEGDDMQEDAPPGYYDSRVPPQQQQYQQQYQAPQGPPSQQMQMPLSTGYASAPGTAPEGSSGKGKGKKLFGKLRGN